MIVNNYVLSASLFSSVAFLYKNTYERVVPFLKENLEILKKKHENLSENLKKAEKEFNEISIKLVKVREKNENWILEAQKLLEEKISFIQKNHEKNIEILKKTCELKKQAISIEIYNENVENVFSMLEKSLRTQILKDNLLI